MQNKAWCEYFGSVFMEYYNSVGKPTKEEFEAAIAPLANKFKSLDSAIIGPYFNGKEVWKNYRFILIYFNLFYLKLAVIDFCIAPLAQRLFVLDEILGIDVGDKKKV